MRHDSPVQIRKALEVLERASDEVKVNRDTLLDAALEAVRLAAEADVAVTHRIGRVGDLLLATSYRVRAPPAPSRALDAVFRLGYSPPHDYRSPSTRRRGFVLLSQICVTPAELVRNHEVLARTGLSDQLRLVVFDGPRFVAHIGAFARPGESSFSKRLPSLMQSLAPAIVGLLTAAATREDAADYPKERYALLVRPDGHVEHATPGATRWLGIGRFAAALRALVRERARAPEGHHVVLLDGIPATIVRLQGTTGSRFLVEPTRAAPFVLDAGVVLSPTQKRVADLAACGLTLDEIAAELGAARETVKSHLRECYRRLGVSTRLELARALQER